jgi:GNAT superfamily N-acetyltransferase
LPRECAKSTDFAPAVAAESATMGIVALLECENSRFRGLVRSKRFSAGFSDPAAQGAHKMANQPDQGPITVLPATPAHWPDIEEFFAHTPCWCQYWRLSASQYGRISKNELLESRLAERREALRSQLQSNAPPGVIAYLGDRIVGWCGFWPRTQMERLVRSRTIPAVDDRPVWSIVCFLVRPGYRRRGVARALLQGAIECARAHGAPALEAYPVDPAGKRLEVTSAYVGTLSMFEEAGFRRIVETSARSAGLARWLVRLEL